MPSESRSAAASLWLWSPFNETALALLQAIPGRRWEGEEKANRVPLSQKRALWSVLLNMFPGALAHGPGRLFVIEAARKAA